MNAHWKIRLISSLAIGSRGVDSAVKGELKSDQESCPRGSIGVWQNFVTRAYLKSCSLYSSGHFDSQTTTPHHTHFNDTSVSHWLYHPAFPSYVAPVGISFLSFSDIQELCVSSSPGLHLSIYCFQFHPNIELG